MCVAARINEEEPVNAEIAALLKEFKETEKMTLLAKDVVILNLFR